MKIDEIIIDEGVNDPDIFKCIFLIGSPGSGKTFVGNKLFQNTGLKKINLDDVFEYKAKKTGEDLKTLPSTKKGKDLIDQSWKQVEKKRSLHLDGRLGIIMDITGRKLDRVLEPKKMFEELGYECFCVIVNTDIDTARERNNARERSVPDYFLTQAYTEVQQNLGAIQQAFGPENTLIIDNSGKQDQQWDYYWKQIQKFLKKPLSHIAQGWIKSQKN